MNAQTFTRAGGDPDLSALATAIRPTLGDPFYLEVAPGSVTIRKPSAWTAPQITAVQAAVTACAAQTAETDAENQIDTLPLYFRKALLLILDEINIVRTNPTAVLAARTEAQLWAAMKNRVAP